MNGSSTLPPDYETLRIGGLTLAGLIVFLSVILLAGNKIRNCGRSKPGREGALWKDHRKEDFATAATISITIPAPLYTPPTPSLIGTQTPPPSTLPPPNATPMPAAVQAASEMAMTVMLAAAASSSQLVAWPSPS
ncbi:hypothetical protein NHX12_008216 [Muraenolepis orangiensis]|uniref:FXYD domain-containing ion transport regulator n=1 Tax=Muraenolepis orangiensis TaxID=630683 RepID=A0A9Q0I7V8_9TELE|nr:hypothetical protein NHX12_008216 [Muraenolepis orangiensis]